MNVPNTQTCHGFITVSSSYHERGREALQYFLYAV